MSLRYERALQALSDFYGCEKNLEVIKRQVYKNTSFGGWVRIDSKGQIILGSIVEGSDAEPTCSPIITWHRSNARIFDDIQEAIAWLDGETSMELEAMYAELP